MKPLDSRKFMKNAKWAFEIRASENQKKYPKKQKEFGIPIQNALVLTNRTRTVF